MITQDNLVILKAQVGSDADNGGGLPTNQSVPNHVSNALFPDVSDTDRMMGRVRLRKIFLAVQSVNDELIQSARLIFTKIPQKMSVFAFKASSFADRRADAKDRMESYLARGARWAGHLLESHLKGQKTIQLSLDPSDNLPAVGSALVLVQNENQADEYHQFVRVTKVHGDLRKFYVGVDKAVTRLVATVEISDSLRHDFMGLSVLEYLNNANDKRFGIVRETIVADAAQYYSASHLSKPITAMTTQTVNLDSIYVSVVPSTQVETPLVQNNPSMNSTFFVKGNDEKVSQTIHTSKTNQLGAVYPTSLTVIIGGVTYHDDNGEIRNNSTTIGNIAYETGVINWYSGYVGRTAQISFIPAGYQTGANHTEVIKVPQVGAGFNYVYTLAHTPLPLSIKVSYQSGGEVYTLTDVGGKLTGHGVGTINDKTLMITTSAIPDSDSLIIISYGTDNGALAVGGMTKRLYASITTDKIPSEVLCDGKALNFEVVDDGIRVYFDKLPQKGAVMTLKQANNHTATDGLGMTVDDKNGTLKMVLDRPIIRGSLVISVMGVTLGDDGRGNVIFLGGYEKLQGTNETSNMTNKTFASVMERTTNHYGEMMGVVDYEARTVIIHKPLQIQSVQTVNQPISGFRS